MTTFSDPAGSGTSIGRPFDENISHGYPENMISRWRKMLILASVVTVGIVFSITGCTSTMISIPSPMPTSQFWSIISAARGTSNPTAPSATPSALKRQLEALSDAKIAAFSIRYDETMIRLNRWTIWDAGYAAAQGMGDDDFDYFRAWLIGKGEKVAQQAEADPDELVRYFTPIDASKDDFDNESLDYVADDILSKRFGQAADDSFDDKTATKLDDDPPGKETNEKTIDARYPLLTAWAKQNDH